MSQKWRNVLVLLWMIAITGIVIAPGFLSTLLPQHAAAASFSFKHYSLIASCKVMRDGQNGDRGNPANYPGRDSSFDGMGATTNYGWVVCDNGYYMAGSRIHDYQISAQGQATEILCCPFK